ncbi:hypothetical protein [Alcanivorax sp. P2S70]|uniref:hypothetical protein n=1 Tax=Alcanivorax sp. P2S70 TaxID=1397527 RepID=UPI0004B323FD|nr:hypothetical protein [Alcanivorax sp. P2S70]
MANQLKLLVGSSALAAMLAACGGGGGSSSPSSDAADAVARTLPPEIASIIDQQNELTNVLCPEASGEVAEGGSLDPLQCFQEGEEDSELSQDMIVQQFCPEAVTAFDPEGLFDPSLLQEDPQAALTGFVEQSGTFAAACLQEAAGSLQNAGDLLGASNPITEAICPVESANGEVDPANCFAEAVAGGSLPGGGDGGDAEADPIAGQLCPETGSVAPSPEAPTACLDEASRVYITIIDMITAPNPLTEQICPMDAADGRVNPPDCFAEATMGAGGFPGDGGGDSNPFKPLLEQFCPEAALAPVGPTTPVDCLAEAGGNFEDVQDLLLGPNPLTENLCPEAAQTTPIDPAACFMEVAGGGLPGGGGGDNPLAPVLEQFCPETAAGEVGPTTPVDCLTEAGSAFGDVQDLISGSNPLTDQFCPEESADGQVDPAACFQEAAGGGLPGGGDNPLAPVLEQFCPETAAGDVSPTTPVDCLAEAGSNFQDVQDLLLGPNPLTENLCPEAAQTTPIDPAACFEEAAGGGDGGDGGDGGNGGSDNPLAPVLEQFCPETAAGDVGPTTPIDCLTEAGAAFGDVQDLISGSNPLTEQLCPEESADGMVDPAACFQEALAMGGELPGGGGDNPLAPVLEQFCPETAEGDLGPTTPIDCLTEAGGNFQDVQDLLLGPNPLTENLCPQAAASTPIDPAACFEEAAAGGLPGGGGGNPLAPVLEQFCPETADADVGPTTPIDCLTEAGAAFGDVQDLISGSNPLTEQLCPEESADGTVDPAACFQEALAMGGELPGGGENPFAPVLEQFCPETATGEVGPTTPIDCLTEAGSAFGDVQDLISGSNPLTEQFCPAESADGQVDPAACFEEALSGGTPGGGENPLAPVLEQFCPNTAEAEVGPTTPVDCLTEAGSSFGNIEDIIGGANPLTEALCPMESADGSVDPAACFEEAVTGGMPGGGDNPLAPALEQFCPETAAGDLGPTTPADCLAEAGAGLAALEELLGPLSEPNPLTEQVCPQTSATGSVDPRACFVESLDNVELLNTESIGLLPGCPLLSAFNEEGNLSLTLGLGCLINQEAPEQPSLDTGALTELFDTLFGGFM